MVKWTKNENAGTLICRLNGEEELEAVLALYRKQKAILGLMPDGAFQQRAKSGQIYVAKENEAVVGYLLFAVNLNNEVRIAHLCVAEEYRKRGLSRKLISALTRDYASYSRVRLNCRSDFDAAKVWPRLGFFEARRIPGRKQDGSELIVFHLPLKETPLFDFAEDSDDAATIVCDANVCFDIELPDRPRHAASRGLLADWLRGEICLRTTNEVYNDIARQEEPLRGTMTTAVRSNWETIAVDHREVDRYVDLVRSVLGSPTSPSESSDQRHLAIAAACQATAFATHDSELLDRAEDLLNVTGLRVQRPSEIITEFDSVLRAHRYQYRELTRSGIERRRVMLSDEFDLQFFSKPSDGERLNQVRAQIDEALSIPDDWDVHCLVNTSDESIVMFVVRKQPGGARQVQRLRLDHRLAGTRFGRTLAQYVAHQPLGAWRSGERRVLEIVDPCLSALMKQACLGRGFREVGNSLWRVSLPGIWAREPLLAEVRSLVSEGVIPEVLGHEVAKLARKGESPGNELDIQRLEQLIHPGKVTFGHLPTYVIPIQPRWAKELFDFRIWDIALFNPETALVINSDSVYYKQPKNGPNTDFGRILWYVSGETKKGGKCVRACSALTKGVIGTVKNLFREFARMGVFEWPQLMEHFGGPEAFGLALEFTDTELLEQPVSFDTLNDILEESGMKRQQFMSTVEIPPDAFHEVYRRSRPLK